MTDPYVTPKEVVVSMQNEIDRYKRQYESEKFKNERLEHKIKDMSPCDSCMYEPPSSCDGKPCTMCPASKKIDFGEE